MLCISRALTNQGRYQESEKADREALQLQQEVLGDDHPNTINTISSLAVTYRKLGRNLDAESLQLQALELSKVVSGEDIQPPSLVWRV